MNSEFLKKVLKLRLALGKKSKKSFLGSYRSALRGTGVTLSDFREYTYGDDVRSVSWPLTAKMGKPYIKLFEEDRGLSLMLMIDVSASSYFGSMDHTKLQVIQQIAAVLAFSAEQSQDQVGLLLFSDKVEHYVAPKKGRNHILRILRDIYTFQPQSSKTNFKQPCSYLLKVLKKRSHIFILSDLFSDDFEKHLRFLSYRHDMVSIIVQDHLEKEIPKIGLIDLEDSETGESITVDTSSSFFQKDFSEKVQTSILKREQMLKKMNLRYLYIDTNKDIFKPLIHFFNKKSL